jgi:hypothetical protein
MSVGNVEVGVIQYSSGTYTRNTLGLVSITLNDHGFLNTDTLYVKFTTGDAVSVLSQGCTVLTPNTFTIQTSGVGIAAGSVLVSKVVFNRSGIYAIDSSMKITIDVASHGLPDGSDIYLRYTSGSGESGPAVIERIINSGRFTVVKKNNPGGFYGEFGVKGFHEQLYYGQGIKVYVIDEGFNDVDLTAPGVQTTTDLADFTIVNISDPGAGGGGLSHGGLVCALLGASRKNGAGIIGICPDAELFIADVDDANGDIFITKVVQAIDDAIARGVDIINMSLGTEFNSPIFSQAVQRAINANILVFASAGNSGATVYEYPAAYTGVISVASVNIQRQPSSFNTRNDKVDLFAPGENYPLPSPLNTQDIVYVNGTSFSSPFAAGLAALYINRRRQELLDPTFRPSATEIINVLKGENYLNTASITSLPDTTNSSSDGVLAGASIMVAALALVIIVLLFLGSRRTSTPVYNKV